MKNDAETINRTVDILALHGGATPLKKVANCESGEWCGPCPFCGGVDRFRIQPYHPDGGRWFCRGCGGNHWHSVIDYVMKRDAVDFLGAFEQLGGGKIKVAFDLPTPAPRIEEPGKWGDAAYQFVEDSASNLWGKDGRDDLEYLHGRGLDDETLRHWAIGSNSLEGYGNSREWGVAAGERVFLPRGIVIPCYKNNLADIVYIKIRRNSGEPKYMMLKGGHQWLFGGFAFYNNGIGFMFESELDVLLAWQSGLGVGYASLPAGQKLQRDYFQYFHDLAYLIVSYDNDAPGQRAAEDICQRSKHYVLAQPVPAGKDLTEYWQSTRNMDDVANYLWEQMELATRHG